ncbi:MAG: ParB/RepB/Spo0J family partition protein [Bacteroidales bacterium]|nr:ParB/RepB/Spo0J family partition protein [Bacteroidales bacterium]
MKTKKAALGRGLSAILESPETDITSKDISGNYVVGAIANIALEKIEINPFQPRNNFEKNSLIELADSIKEQGIIQPITVRKLGYDKYQLISGERRYRAAKIAGFKDIPAFIRVANDEQMLEMSLIENIHREDLNSIEIAISYQRLIEECKLTQEKLSERIGINRSTIANFLRLLKLPAEIQIAIRDNQITTGHARALINIDNVNTQLKILKDIIDKNLSVREVEQIVRHTTKPQKITKKHLHIPLPLKYEKIKENLNNQFNTPIELKRNNKGKGSIVIQFKTDEELEKILSIFEK